MPYQSYQIYQAERPKSAAEIRRADEQLGHMGEVGLQDGLAASNTQMDQIFTDFGVTHTFETYEGDHTNRVIERIEMKVLPFFSNNLSFKK